MPTVHDDTLEAFLQQQASTIIEVSENAPYANRFRLRLANFPGPNILGISVGNHEIFISYELTRLAYEQNRYLWLMRQVLAHEIAHDVLRNVSGPADTEPHSVAGFAARVSEKDLGLPRIFAFRNYSRAAELAADKKAIEYWQKTGWDCHIWIEIFRNFLDAGYVGDPDHPTEERQSQAIKMCAPAALE